MGSTVASGAEVHRGLSPVPMIKSVSNLEPEGTHFHSEE